MIPGQGRPQEGVLLSDFEDPEELMEAVGSMTRFELVDGDRPAGGKALRLTHEAVPEGRRDYPAFVLQGKALRLKDFSRFEALGFWVKSLESSEAEISISI